MRLSCDIDDLEPAMRILLTSDGTVTDMLQGLCRERIMARKLTQNVQPAPCQIDPLDLASGGSLMRRSVVLQGFETGTNYIYADSSIAIDRLDVGFREALLNSDTPIGRLWRDRRLEVFKEITGISRVRSDRASKHFGTSSQESVLVRTCRVFVSGVPAMLITEYFGPALSSNPDGYCKTAALSTPA